MPHGIRLGSDEMSKGNRPRNYVPHNKWAHRDTANGDDWEAYLLNLSRTVGSACDKWLAARGIESLQFQGSRRFNDQLVKIPSQNT